MDPPTFKVESVNIFVFGRPQGNFVSFPNLA